MLQTHQLQLRQLHQRMHVFTCICVHGSIACLCVMCQSWDPAAPPVRRGSVTGSTLGRQASAQLANNAASTVASAARLPGVPPQLTASGRSLRSLIQGVMFAVRVRAECTSAYHPPSNVSTHGAVLC